MMGRIRLRVKPGAKRPGIIPSDGVIVVRVREPAREGRANRALVELLARRLRVPKSQIRIVVGERSRDKVVEVEGLIPEEIRRRLEALGELIPVPAGELDGPARRFRIHGGKGEVGFISPLSARFCATCNRLRLTADGKIRACLFSDDEVDLKAVLRAGGGEEGILKALRRALEMKPMGWCRDGFRIRKCQRGMASIGG